MDLRLLIDGKRVAGQGPTLPTFAPATGAPTARSPTLASTWNRASPTLTTGPTATAGCSSLKVGARPSRATAAPSAGGP